MEFSVNIATEGQDGTDNGPALVQASLGRIVQRIESGETSGFIRDGNGNTVGDWELTEPTEPTDCAGCGELVQPIDGGADWTRRLATVADNDPECPNGAGAVHVR